MISEECHEVHDRLAPHHNQATISTGHFLKYSWI